MVRRSSFWIPWLILLSALCWLGGSDARAQDTDGRGVSERRYTLVLRGVPLGEALEQLARTTGMDLVYPSRHVTGKRVYCDGRSRAPEALLRCVLAGSGLDYVRSSSGAYILFASVAEAPQYGGVIGTVVDGVTGEPLAHANVLLAEARTGTTTNAAGLFTMAALVSGPHRVVVTYVGYRPVEDSVWVRPGSTQRLHVALQPDPIAMEPLVVEGLTQRLPSQGLGSGRLTPRESQRVGGVAGTTGGIRGATVIPGVTAQLPFADLHIQGGGAGEHVTLLDGAPVRDPVSLGRYLSALSPLAIGRVTVHKAGFGAERGSHLAGVVEVEHDVAFPGDEHLTVTADPVSLNARLGGRAPLGGASSATFMAAARTSVWGLYRDAGIASLLRSWNTVDPALMALWADAPEAGPPLGPVRTLRNEPEVAFSDLHAAVRLHLTPFQNLYASAYRARNELSSELAAVRRDGSADADRLMQSADAYAWTNWVGQVSYANLLGARSTLMVQAFGSWNESLGSYAAVEGAAPPVTNAARLPARVSAYASGVDGREENRIRELTLKAELNHSVSSDQQVYVGVSAAHVQSDLLLWNTFIAPFQSDAEAWNIAGTVAGRRALGIRTTVEPGLRLTYLPGRRSLYAEPRLSVRHDGAAGPAGAYAVRFAGGLYRQFISEYALTSAGATALVPWTLVWLPVDGSVAPPRAYHLSADALLLPGEAWTIALDVYYKWLPRLLTLDYPSLLAEGAYRKGEGVPGVREHAALAVAGQGRAYGAGLRARHQGHRLTASVAYSYGRAVRKVPGRFRGASMPAPWEEPHVLQGSADVRLTPRLELGAEWRSVWGRTWGLRRAYYDYLANGTYARLFAGYDLDDPAAAELPPLHRLDIGASYRLRFGRAEVRMRLAVANLLDRHNVYDWSLTRTYASPSRVARALPGRRLLWSAQLSY